MTETTVKTIMQKQNYSAILNELHRLRVFHPKWWTAAHLNHQDNNELLLTISNAVRAPTLLPPPPPPPVILSSTVNQPRSTSPFIRPSSPSRDAALLTAESNQDSKTEEEEEEEEETALCWKNNFRLWRTVKIFNAKRKKGKWRVSDCDGLPWRRS